MYYFLRNLPTCFDHNKKWLLRATSALQDLGRWKVIMMQHNTRHCVLNDNGFVFFCYKVNYIVSQMNVAAIITKLRTNVDSRARDCSTTQR